MSADSTLPNSRRFASYDAWLKFCQAHGYRGPFKIYGQPHLQFVEGEPGCTVALWSDATQKGYAMSPAQKVESDALKAWIEKNI